MWRRGGALLLLVLTIGCASAPRGPGLPKRLNLFFKGRPGRVTVTRNLSVSHTLAFDDGQLLRDRREAVDFTARTHVTAVDGQGRVSSEVTTLNKDGTTPLVELAYPEPGESIAYVTAADGTVLRAGDHPSSSLFFIPALPLPKHEVAIGDTWDFDHEWRSGTGGMPLKLEVTGILRNIVPCAGGEVCADVEISGRVSLEARPDRPDARFVNRVRGRALFSVDRGEVRWSEMRSREEFISGAKRSVVDSCMVAHAALNAEVPPVACTPGDDVEIRVPAL